VSAGAIWCVLRLSNENGGLQTRNLEDVSVLRRLTTSVMDGERPLEITLPAETILNLQ
jgi:hypothetical protein